jgi:hypothetical protein
MNWTECGWKRSCTNLGLGPFHSYVVIEENHEKLSLCSRLSGRQLNSGHPNKKAACGNHSNTKFGGNLRIFGPKRDEVT